jgi:heat shock protein HslJ
MKGASTLTAMALVGWQAAAGAAGPMEACQQPAASRSDFRNCLDQRLRMAEAAMESAAMSMHSSMTNLSQATGRADVVAAFEDSERAFREYMDRHCAWVGAAESSGRSSDVVSDCLIRLTEQHTAQLQSELSPGQSAATRPQKAFRVAAIPGGEWRLTYVEREGQRMTLPDQPRATLSFDNGTAAGHSFVNRYFGTASVTEFGRLSWVGELGSTRMAGPPGLMEVEDQYLEALSRVTRWRVEGDTLTLDSADHGVLLRYSR